MSKKKEEEKLVVDEGVPEGEDPKGWQAMSDSQRAHIERMMKADE